MHFSIFPSIFLALLSASAISAVPYGPIAGRALVARSQDKSDVKKSLEHLKDVNVQGQGPSNQLSGGEQQRVVAAKALTVQPQQVHHDEPVEEHPKK